MNRQTTWVLAAIGAIALLALNVALTFLNTREMRRDDDWVEHTHEVLAHLDDVLLLATDAETGERGYLIAGETQYLEPYKLARASLDQKVAELEALISDNEIQLSKLSELDQRLGVRMKLLEQGIALRSGTGFEAARQIVLSGEGKREMDAIRRLIADMQAHEHELLVDRSQQSDHTYKVAILAGVISGVVAMAAVGAFVALLMRHAAARTKAALVIAEQSERLRTTLSSIGDGVITTDLAGRVTNLNPVAEALTGWTNAQAEGHPLEEVFRIVNEDTRETVANPAMRALKEGVVVGLANHTILIAKDGVERPIDDSAAPIRCKLGELVGCVLVFRDVTERRHTEQALSRSEARLRFVMDAMPQKLYTALPDGAIDYFNPIWSEYTGLPFEEIRHWGWTAFIHPDDLEETLRRWRHSIATGESFQVEHRFRRADGEYRWHLGRAIALRDDSGRIAMWAGSDTDINRQVRAAEELRKLSAELSEADRRKDEFLAVLAHELRNPLAPIANALQLMRLSPDDRAVIEQARRIIERQFAQMVHLVDDLLDVSRISRGKIVLRQERVPLGSVLNSAVETSRPAVEARGQQLNVDLPAEPVFVEGDSTRLAQVFANLLNNAAKFSEPRGQITLSAQQRGDEVVVSVRDTGLGIPADVLPRVFEMFTQGDRSLERSQGGLGIGLTLVKTLVELHGGSVEAASEGPGRGSEFTVRLPVAGSAAARRVATPTGPGDGDAASTARAGSRTAAILAADRDGSRPPSKILVADDNVDSATSLAMMLRHLGHDVRMVHDGLAALEQAESFDPDVVLLDIGMPVLNGYEVCRRLRLRRSAKRVVLIAVTGWGQQEDKRRSEEAGFDHHVVKPVDTTLLKRLIDGA